MGIIPYTDATRKWAAHKNLSIVLAERLRAAGIAAGRKDIWLRGDIMADCSTRIEYTYCPECGSMHLRRTYLCRDRLCPLCAWRLSLQRIAEMMQTIDYLTQQRQTVSAAMLTLTVRNCALDTLGATISAMTAAWDRLCKRRSVRRWVSGYARSVEITRASDGTYHPHIHVLIVWADSYDKDIHQRTWADMWRECLQVDYTPIVDIRTAYGRTSDATAWDKLLSATVEATKYCIKGMALQSIPDTDLIAVADAIKGKRLMAYGGCIRAARAALRMTADDMPTDVSDTTIDCPKCGCTDTAIMAYQWAQDTGMYLLSPYPYSV